MSTSETPVLSLPPSPPAAPEPPLPLAAAEEPASDCPSSLAAAYAACALSIGASLTFFLTGVVSLPVLLYFPLSRRFGFHSQLGELSMDYYGRSLLALLVGVSLALVVYLLCSPSSDRSSEAPATDGAGGAGDAAQRLAQPAVRDRLALLAAYVVTAAALTAGLFAYQLGTRVPTPEPLPTAAQSPRI